MSEGAASLPYCTYRDMLTLTRCLLSQTHDGDHALITEEMWGKLMDDGDESRKAGL